MSRSVISSGKRNLEESDDHSLTRKMANSKAVRKVGYVWSQELLEVLDHISMIESRSFMVHFLVEAYGLLEHMKMILPGLATEENLRSFHSEDYVNALKSLEQDNDEDPNESLEDFGFGFDCPILKKTFSFTQTVAGSSLSAAKSLIAGDVDVAINWCGGWHHAQRDSASGFCYVNDIVLAILQLIPKFKRILYIDLDVHHGDGVANAFESSNKVFTLSLHNYETGYFPGTGSLRETGIGYGKGFNCNVPLREGITDEDYFHVFKKVADAVLHNFRPYMVVCQCGSDGITQDPLGAFNLTLKGYGDCVRHIMTWDLPILFLGGGGYNVANAARCWTYLTSIICGVDISTDIPEHDYFEKYGPDFRLSISRGLRRNANTKEYLDYVVENIIEGLEPVRQSVSNVAP